MKKFYLIYVLGLGITSCKKQENFTPPILTASDSILIEGHYRVFHFKEPSLSSTKRSLIFILHGSGGSGAEMQRRTVGLENLSEKDNLLLVYPDAYKKFWNSCRAKANDPSTMEKINENLFFDKMILYFEKKYLINPSHFFAVGISGGGHMVYKLGLTMPHHFKGIAAVIANLPDTNNMDCPISKSPIAVLISNGTADPINPYNGGLVQLGNYNFGFVRSTDETFRYWASVAGYQGEPVNNKVTNYDKISGQRIERSSYTDVSKPDVVLLKIIGGSHDLPKGIDIFIEAWSFFKKQIEKNG